MDKNKIIVGEVRQRRAGEPLEGTRDAWLWLPDGSMLEACGITAVEDDFIAPDKPLLQANLIQAMVRTPDGSLWMVMAKRMSSGLTEQDASQPQPAEVAQ